MLLIQLKVQLHEIPVKVLIAGVDIGPNREYPNLFAACDKVLGQNMIICWMD